MINLDSITLSVGPHLSREHGVCLMEAVAYFAGERHSAAPKCASHVLTASLTSFNDILADDDRQLLKSLIPKLIGTRSTPEVDRRRMFSLVDSVIREIVPMAIVASGLLTRLHAVGPVMDEASSQAAAAIYREVADAARKRATVTTAADYCETANAVYGIVGAAQAAVAYNYTCPTVSARMPIILATSIDAAADAAYAAFSTEAADADARMPIILASIAAFERAIAIT